MKGTLSVDNPRYWDSPVSTKLIKEWASTVKEGILQDSLWLPCATSCTCAVKKPRLVGFWDRSSQAFTAVIYAVTMVSKTDENNQYVLPDGDMDNRDYDFISTNLNLTYSLQRHVLPHSRLGSPYLKQKPLDEGFSNANSGFWSRKF